MSETEEVVRAGAKRSQETRRRREAPRRGDELNVRHKYLSRDIMGCPRIFKFKILILTYPGLCKFRHLNPTYPNSSWDILFF